MAKVHPTSVSPQFRPSNKGAVVYRLGKIFIRMQMSIRRRANTARLRIFNSALGLGKRLLGLG
ncbi:hypothetical protein [Nostoc commune]|uniref:hypothetical protein n=1 Tax=Nostoc commune TaxID=1178 RepID=UPI0011B1E947|nr:hypothetical protein [Nostoc commune]